MVIRSNQVFQGADQQAEVANFMKIVLLLFDNNMRTLLISPLFLFGCQAFSTSTFFILLLMFSSLF